MTSYVKAEMWDSFLGTICHNLLVDEDIGWHHSSVATALWNGGFDVRLFAEEYAETKNIISKLS